MNPSVGAVSGSEEVWMWPMGCSVPSADPDVLCEHLEAAVLFLAEPEPCRSVCGISGGWERAEQLQAELWRLQ